MLKNINKQIEDFSQEEINTIENFAKRLGLEKLRFDEKTSISQIYNAEFNPKLFSKSLKTYPLIDSGFGTEHTISTINSTFLISLLRKNIELLESQSTLIEQNQQIIELLTKISEK